MLTVSEIKRAMELRSAIGENPGFYHDHFKYYSPLFTKKDVLENSFKRLMKYSDEKLRWSNCYEGATNPVEPNKSRDPLYRKLAKAIKIARGKLDGLDGMIEQRINEEYMIKLEERRMRAETYIEMNNKSAQEIYNHVRDKVKADLKI